MARKAETGIQYYPCNTDHVINKKIKLLYSKFKANGFWIYECLKCEAYKGRGYFVDTKDEEAMILFAEDICKLPIDLVKEVISECIKRELFDKKMYEQYGILTTDRIQENYLGGTSRRLNGVKMVREFLLIDPTKFEKIVIVDISGENVNIIAKNVDSKDENVLHRYTEREREGDKKEKEILKGEGETGIPPELFKKLFSYLKKNSEKYYPNERKKAQNEMIDWQREKSITQELIDSDPELNKQNSEQIEWLFKKHMGRDMTLQIENCYNHYARTDFVISGEKIKAWIPVLAGWMNKRDQFSKKKTA